MTGEPGTGALIWSPFADQATALAAVRTLLTEGLIACGNLLPGMTSVFSWQGRVETAQEVGVLLKTNAALLDHAIARLAELHPYEDPAVLGWCCASGAPATLEWLAGIARTTPPES